MIYPSFLFGVSCGAALSTTVFAFLRRRKNAIPPGITIQKIAPPHPEWHPPDKSPTPFSNEEMLVIDPSTMDKRALYTFVISAVVPRPIAFVSTIDLNGLHNLSPYSYFNTFGHDPPIVAIGIARSSARNGDKKDTLHNIEQTKEFVICIISDWFLEAANHTCGEYPPDVDEMKISGLTPVPSTKVKPPRIAESAIHMECRLREIREYEGKSGAPSSALVIGEVVCFHVHPTVATTSRSGHTVVDPVALRPVCRLGGIMYGVPTTIFDLPRPDANGVYPTEAK